MAESAVSFVINNLVSLLVEEANLLKGVKGDIESLKNELESVQAFLKDADGKAGDEGIKTWLKQVRLLAFNIEDILDEFVLHVSCKSHRYGLTGFLSKITQAINIRNRKHHHCIATEIQVIKERLVAIKQRSERYHFNSTSSTSTDTTPDPRIAALYTEDSELIDIEKPKYEVINRLLQGDSSRRVFTVVGPGGVGKTTLVKKVYDCKLVRDHFDFMAWITVSQRFKVEDILNSLINLIHELKKGKLTRGNKAMTENQLIDTLRQLLKQKSYLIVLDDVWSIDLWDSVKFALLDNKCSSRIVMTSRNADLPSFIVESPSDSYALGPLPEEKAKELFFKKAFGSSNFGVCPANLMELSSKIVKKCGGLPLALVAVGGLLSTKEKTVQEWGKLHESLAYELKSNPNLATVMKILSLSYYDLPYYLKPCFLYFGVFPEDYQIWSSRITKLWVAEGFINRHRGKTLEEVSEDYLNELIRRNLVHANLPKGRTFFLDGSTRQCRVHDLIHEFILSRFEEENFCEVLGETKTEWPEMNVRRRLSIHGNIEENVRERLDPSYVRSIFGFRMNLCCSTSFLARFRLLKVLDLENAPIENFPMETASLCHLRYLSLRNTKIRVLPSSLWKIKSLQFLDIVNTNVFELPIEIVKLQKLRHLLAYQYNLKTHPSFDVVEGIKLPDRIESLTALQSLSAVEIKRGSRIISNLGTLKQLRMLVIKKLRRENVIDLCSSIKNMNHLQYLAISSSAETEFLDLKFMSSIPLSLSSLSLAGCLEEMPECIKYLHNLVKISLRWSRLKDDPTIVLKALPSLIELRLCAAYEGEGLHFGEGNFTKLKNLRLGCLDKLKMIVVEEGALPVLEQLRIGYCGKLKEVPQGIANIGTLKSLDFINMAEEFIRRCTRDTGEDYWKLKHIPKVTFKCWQEGQWVYR